MPRDRVPLFGAGLALIVLGLLVAVDMSFPPEYAVLSSLFGLAPLIACAVVPATGTAGIGVLAVATAFASGWWNGTMGTPQQNVRILNVVLVSAAAIAIAVVRVHRERRFEEVSAIAEAAQRAILPVLPASVGGVAVATRYRSAAHGALVGGDLYDCYHSENRVRFLIGDVRGKGIAGVEQAARVIRAFRQSAALRESLTDVAEEMDDYLAGFFGEEEFVTALLVEVSGPGRLTLFNAGHPPPQLVRTTGQSELLELPVSLPFGLDLGGPSEVAAASVPWTPGDRLLLYTDGLSEARDRSGRFLDLSSLADGLRDTVTVDAALDDVLGHVAGHVPRGHLEDDLALLLLENTADSTVSERPPKRT
ncbi:MAG: PP2C family protein-serine/threonine phosphatase [Nocardioides sp.]